MSNLETFARHRDSPYQGLVPYREEDAPFFFGREQEIRLITANLFAAPLTLLYGMSGVGKSSVLHAGVVHQSRSRDDVLVVVFDDWKAEPGPALKACVVAAASRLTGESLTVPDASSLCDSLGAISAQLGRRLMIVLDQFEEYFLYHPQFDSFAHEFSEAVRQIYEPVSFLISMREDSIAKLDRFEDRIPGLFDNYLRIEHLSREAARHAIEKPIEHFNELFEPAMERAEVEAALVEAVLDQIQPGSVLLGVAGRGRLKASPDTAQLEARVEAPYLQLVMSRLWEEESEVGSRQLRLATLRRLGGSRQIVRGHLDRVMDELTSAQRRAAAAVFHHLVTPSGTKIAHNLSDLATYAGMSRDDLAPLVERLSGRARILRSVPGPPKGTAEPRYEIFHDALAPAILDWQTRDTRSEQRGRFAAQMLLAFLALVFTVNFLQVSVDSALRTRFPAAGRLVAEAALGQEGYLSFEGQELVGPFGVYLTSTTYYFLLPLLTVVMTVGLRRRMDASAFRTLALAICIAYAVCLPFYVLLPLPERWFYSGADAILLSDLWSTALIEAVRPMSGLDNCFPSFSAALVTVLALVSFRFRLRQRFAVLLLGIAVIISSFILGIQWMVGIVAGVALGALSVPLALRFDTVRRD